MIRKLAYATTALLLLSSSAFAEEDATAKYCVGKAMWDNIKQVVDDGRWGRDGIHLLLIRQPKFVDLKKGDDFILTCAGIGYFSTGEQVPIHYGAKAVDGEWLVWIELNPEEKPAAKKQSKK